MQLNTEDFENLRKEMTAHDEQREIVIRKSRELTKLSKQAIYCFHDGEIEKGKSILADANLKIEASLPLATAELRGGSFSAAMEEYVEAYCFMQYLTDETLIESTQVPLAHWSEYIGGVLDFTGELVRYGIKMATERDIPKVQQCASMVKAIERQFSLFDFLNGSLSKKCHVLGNSLRKLEDTLYELSLLN